MLSVGKALLCLVPEQAHRQYFDELFDIVTPDIETLADATDQASEQTSFFIKVSGSPATLRGQIMIPSPGYILFVGSILVTGANSLEELGVSLNVFSPFDLTPDIVILHKFRDLENRDLEARVKRLAHVSQAHEEMSEHANTDELTQIKNRRGFWSAGEKILKELEELNTSRLLIALLDLDGFKSVNDQYGHDTGDALLRTTAERIANVVGTSGLVGRLGGDEFVVLMILDEIQNKRARVQQLLNTINSPIEFKHNQISINASIGVAKIEPGDSLELGIHNADVAMYEGRLSNTGPISWFTEDLSQKIKAKNDLHKRLKVAIAERKIKPHFQPIIDISDSRLCSFEALARWHDDDLGDISPAVFIGLAEEANLLETLDQQILEQSLDQLAAWRAAGKAFSIHVNVSAPSLNHKLVDRVFKALGDRNLESQLLTLELTETTILENTETAKDVLEQLTANGVRLQLDDFGTGFSSLSHLRDFPVSGLKIDRSFVQDVHVEPKSQALLKSVASIASNLTLDIVAEGIECAEQMEYLRKVGCHFGQGFYIGKPLEADACENLFPQLNKRAA